MFSLSIERQSKIIVLLKSCFLPSQDTDHSLSLINWQGTSPTANHGLLFRDIFRVKTNYFYFSWTIQLFIMRWNLKGNSKNQDYEPLPRTNPSKEPLCRGLYCHYFITCFAKWSKVKSVFREIVNKRWWSIDQFTEYRTDLSHWKVKYKTNVFSKESPTSLNGSSAPSSNALVWIGKSLSSKRVYSNQ